jgi:ankyrin repeat protein
MMMDDMPEDFCLNIRRAHQDCQRWGEARGRYCGLPCFEVLFGSDLISDVTRLHILRILRVRVPWLFFVKDEKDKYPLHLAASKMCSSRVLQYLLRMNPAAADAQDRYGRTPLHSLFYDGYVETKHFGQFKELLAASPKALCTKDADGCTPLALACKRYGSPAPKTVLELLQAYPKAASTKDEKGNLPAHYFCRTKNIPNLQPSVFFVLHALLEAEPEAAIRKDNDGDYLLHKVARYGSPDVVKLVYEAYPEAIRFRDCTGSTPLHLAALDSSVEKIQYLYSLHPEAAQMADSYGATLLHCATKSGSLEILRTVYAYNPGAVRQDSTDTCRFTN